MKKIFLSIVIVLIGLCSYAQTTVRANDIIADNGLFPPVRDTLVNPRRVGELRHRPQDTTIYYAISMLAPHKWLALGKGSGGGGADGNGIYGGSGSLPGNVVVNLDGFDLGFTGVTSGVQIFGLSTTLNNENSFIRAQSGSNLNTYSQFTGTTTNISSSFSLGSTFNLSQISSINGFTNSLGGNLTYQATNHTFNGKVGILVAPITAKLHLPAGTTGAQTAPLKFTTTSSALLTTPEPGAMEVLVDSIYWTGNSGTRYKLYPQTLSTPTWQQTLTAGSTLTQDNTAVNGANTFEFTGNSVAGDPIVSITSTSTAAANDLQKGLNIDLSGANVNSGQDTYGIYSSNTHTGTGAVNIAGRFTASGGSTNYGIYADGATRGVLGFSAAGVGVYGQSAGSGSGVWAISSSGYGLEAQTTTGAAAIHAQVNPSSTNTGIPVLRLTRGTSGTAAINEAGSIDFVLQTTLPAFAVTSQVISRVTDPANATITGQYAVTTNIRANIDTSYTAGDYVALTESSATKFTSTTLAASKIQGGEVLVTVEANDGTDFQSRTLRFIWSAVNKAGTLTITISTPEEVVAVSSGTLTATITAVDAGSGVLDFKVNAVSSLTQTTLRATYQKFKNF